MSAESPQPVSKRRDWGAYLIAALLLPFGFAIVGGILAAKAAVKAARKKKESK